MVGITFGDKHSFNDLNMILSSASIAPAEPKELFVDIPGGDGSVDLTEALGETRYNDRECEFVFTVLPQYDFEAKKQEISNFLNGKRMNIVYDRDPNYYWEGRCKVNEYATDRNIHQIVIAATVKPYKYEKTATTVSKALSSTAANVTLACGRKTTIPDITCTGSTKIVFKGNTFNLAAGTHRVLGIQLTEGTNTLSVSGSGTLTVSYRKGEL